MSEHSDIDEFNDRVGTSAQSGSMRSRVTAAPLAEEPEGEKKEGKTKDATMWAVNGPAFFPCDESVKELEPAQYIVAHSPNSGFFFKKISTSFDDLLHLPDSASDEIVNEIKTFWGKEDHFRRFGFLWKRGFLLWGPPGSGKTCTLQLVSQEIIKRGGISVYAENPQITAQGLAIFRRIEPKRPCVVMMEDLDAMIANHGEADVLALLDGELQIDNVIFIATTNYPERLDKRIVNRPSRFDIVKLVDMPNAEARRLYLLAKNKRLETAEIKCDACDGAGKVTDQRDCAACEGKGGAPEVDVWVKKTEGYSIAHLKELIVSVEVFEGDLNFVIKRLDAMMSRKPKASDAVKPSGQYA